MDVLRFNEDNFIGDDELADTSGRIDPGRAQYDSEVEELAGRDLTAPLPEEEEKEIKFSKEERAEKIYFDFRTKLREDPLFEFLQLYAGKRRVTYESLFVQPAEFSKDFAVSIIDLIPPDDKRRGDMALTFYLSELGRAESSPFVKLEQWKKHRWSTLKPQPYSDAVSAAMEVSAINSEKSTDANEYIGHENAEVRRVFGMLAGWVGVRTDRFESSRSTFASDREPINDEIRRHARRLAFMHF